MAELTTPRAGASLRALVACVALSVLHTWPLAADLDGQSRLDNADSALNTWIVSWVAEALPRDPAHVFDAPIFHPERHTLAYSESLIAQGAMAAPLRAAGLSPTATYNLLVIVGLALSAWAMWRLVASWTGDEWAGALAGAAFAFNAHSLTRFGQIQGLHLEFIPIVLHAVDRLAVRTRPRDALLLAVGIALVGLTSVYLLVFVAGAAVAGMLARAAEWRDRSARAGALTLGGVAMGGLLLTPMLLPYRTLNADRGFVRPLDEVAHYAATWHDYLATGGRLHYAWWSAPHHTSATSLFPGVAVLLLAALAWRGPATQRGRVRMLAGITALGVLLSFGPSLPGYALLYDTLSPFRAIRVASRWGVLWLIGLAGLAGLGLAAWRARLAPRTATIAAAAAFAVVTGEAIRTPMGFTPTPVLPPVYRALAAVADAVVVEYPIYPSWNFNLNAPYLVAQLAHRHPIVNGYSGFAPPDYDARVAHLQTFPADEARRTLDDLGVTHVLIHRWPLRGVLTPEVRAAIAGAPWLREVYADDDAQLLQVLR
ncbi:MAG: hypothetical protein U0P30_18660 [Vicinamibacterales bacterium]